MYTVLYVHRWSTGNVYVTVYKNLVLSLLMTSVIFLVGIDKTDPPVSHNYDIT